MTMDKTNAVTVIDSFSRNGSLWYLVDKADTQRLVAEVNNMQSACGYFWSIQIKPYRGSKYLQHTVEYVVVG